MLAQVVIRATEVAQDSTLILAVTDLLADDERLAVILNCLLRLVQAVTRVAKVAQDATLTVAISDLRARTLR